MTTKDKDKRQPKQLMHFERDTSRERKLRKPIRVIVKEQLYERGKHHDKEISTRTDG